MHKAPFLLRRCDLQGCSRMGAFVLDDGRAICDKHGFLFLVGSERAEVEKARREEEERKTLPDFEPPDHGHKQ